MFHKKIETFSVDVIRNFWEINPIQVMPFLILSFKFFFDAMSVGSKEPIRTQKLSHASILRVKLD